MTVDVATNVADRRREAEGFWSASLTLVQRTARLERLALALLTVDS